MRATVERSAVFVMLLALCASSAPGCYMVEEVKSKKAEASTGDGSARPRQASYRAGTSPASRGGMLVSTLAVPSGRPETSALLLERVSPREVVAGKPFEYLLEVTNLTDMDLADVTLHDTVSSGLDVRSSTPKWSSQADGAMTWALGSIEPGAKKVIRVSGVAKDAGALSACSNVTYATGVCSSIEVVRPQLQLALDAPPETTPCDDIELRYRVANAGTGAAEDVSIRTQLPDGLQTASGLSTFLLRVGTLEAGQSRLVSTVVKAKKSGQFAARAVATGGGDLTAESNEISTIVREPRLEIDATGPSTAFIGRPVSFEIAVKNTGNGAANDAFVEALIPTGARVVSATGDPSPVGNKVLWKLGSLPVDGARSFKLVLATNSPRALAVSAKASAYCATPVTDRVEATVRGIPAILLEVVDLSDPIAVGEEETYEIRVTNQGSAASTNIRVACELEDSMRFIRTSGPTAGRHSDGVVTFAPLPALAPKEKTSWKVVVEAVKEGDVRFGVKLRSDQITRPVDETEATNFYK